MDQKYRDLLAIPQNRLDAINAVLLDPHSKVMNAFLDVVAKYGTPEEINRKHLEFPPPGKPLQAGRVQKPRPPQRPQMARGAAR